MPLLSPLLSTLALNMFVFLQVLHSLLACRLLRLFLCLDSVGFRMFSDLVSAFPLGRCLDAGESLKLQKAHGQFRTGKSHRKPVTSQGISFASLGLRATESNPTLNPKPCKP